MKIEKKLAILNIIFLVGLTFMLAYNYFSFGLVYDFFNEDFSDFQEIFSELPTLIQYLYILLIIIIEVIIGFIPGAVVYVLVGLLVDPLIGSLLIVAGNVIASVANYFQGKLIWAGFNNADFNSKRVRLLHKIEDGGARSLFLLRLNPITSFDFLPYIAGAAGMHFWQFMWSNTLGLLPLIFISTYIGDEFLNKYTWALQVLVVVTIFYIAYQAFKLKRKKS